MSDQPGDRSARVLAERARLLAQPMRTAGEGTDEHKFLLFTSRAAGFSVPLASAAMVRTIGEPLPVTGAPQWLLGFAAIAGRTMPVVDMHSYLAEAVSGQREHPDQRQTVIVLEADGIEIALAVEAIDGVEHGAMAARPLPAGTSPRLTRVCTGLSGKRVVLDPHRLVHELRAALGQTEAAIRYHHSTLPTFEPGDPSAGGLTCTG